MKSFFLVVLCASAHVVINRIHYLLDPNYLQKDIPALLMRFYTSLNTLMTVY